MTFSEGPSNLRFPHECKAPLIEIEGLDPCLWERGQKVLYKNSYSKAEDYCINRGALKNIISEQGCLAERVRENEMENRGSKSTILCMIVKEQRVDGIRSKVFDLRCIIKGFERNHGINQGFNQVC